jgi:G3E family GTPase
MALDGDIDPRHLIDSDQDATAPPRSGFIAEASHSDGIASFVIREKKPLEWPVFQRAAETLIALRGPDLLRIKGLLNLKGSKGPVVFQAVQHLIHPPVELGDWPDKDRSTRLVFITRGVSEKHVRDLLAACRALGYAAGD